MVYASTNPSERIDESNRHLSADVDVIVTVR